MLISRRKVSKRHLEFAANLRIHVLNLACEAVWRQPFGHRLFFKESAVDLLGLCGKYAVQPDGVRLCDNCFQFLGHDVAPSFSAFKRFFPNGSALCCQDVWHVLHMTRGRGVFWGHSKPCTRPHRALRASLLYGGALDL